MNEISIVRLAVIVAVAIGAHLATRVIRTLSRRFLRPRIRSESKLLTISGFVASLLVFVVYFASIGLVLSELGVSLTTYLASASVIGLAVSFGSQGMVQDVITGLTVVFSDLLDVGDMVDIGGQIGIVESVGMRFTVLLHFSGARVFIPNRSITNVSNYPKGYVRAYVDARLPSDASRAGEAEETLATIARSVYAQYPGILLLPPTVEGRIATDGYEYVRIKFRIWPGQGAIIEGPVRAAVTQSLKLLEPTYADWMVSIHYRSEPSQGESDQILPRPYALLRRTGAQADPGARPGGHRA